jgi:hypothetical protein
MPAAGTGGPGRKPGRAVLRLTLAACATTEATAVRPATRALDRRPLTREWSLRPAHPDSRPCAVPMQGEVHRCCAPAGGWDGSGAAPFAWLLVPIAQGGHGRQRLRNWQGCDRERERRTIRPDLRPRPGRTRPSLGQARHDGHAVGSQRHPDPRNGSVLRKPSVKFPPGCRTAPTFACAARRWACRRVWHTLRERAHALEAEAAAGA